MNIQKPRSVGGLGLPVFFKHYYWAANVRALMYWEKRAPGNLTPDIPLWAQMETSLAGTSLASISISE